MDAFSDRDWWYRGEHSAVQVYPSAPLTILLSCDADCEVEIWLNWYSDGKIDNLAIFSVFYVVFIVVGLGASIGAMAYVAL